MPILCRATPPLRRVNENRSAWPKTAIVKTIVRADLPSTCPNDARRRPRACRGAGRARRHLRFSAPGPARARRMLFTIGTFGQRAPISLTRGGPCSHGPCARAPVRVSEKPRPDPKVEAGPAATRQSQPNPYRYLPTLYPAWIDVWMLQGVSHPAMCTSYPAAASSSASAVLGTMSRQSMTVSQASVFW